MVTQVTVDTSKQPYKPYVCQTQKSAADLEISTEGNLKPKVKSREDLNCHISHKDKMLMWLTIFKISDGWSHSMYQNDVILHSALKWGVMGPILCALILDFFWWQLSSVLFLKKRNGDRRAETSWDAPVSNSMFSWRFLGLYQIF